MKKTHKKLFGFFGLGVVATMTVVAIALPSPGVSAISTVTDTITVRVVDDNVNVDINGVESGTTTINPEKDLTITYDNVTRLRVTLTYTDLNGNEQVFNLVDENVEPTPGSLPLNLNLDDPQYGYGNYVLKVVGDGPAGVDEDIVEFSFIPFTAELDDNEESGKTYVDLGYTDSEEASDKDAIGKFVIEVFDQDGNLVTPLSPITVLPPEKKVEVPFDQYDLPAGDYTIKVTAYNREDNELIVKLLTKTIKDDGGNEGDGEGDDDNKEEVIPVPDTGRLLNGANISQADFLITGMLLFLVIGISGVVYIVKHDSRK